MVMYLSPGKIRATMNHAPLQNIAYKSAYFLADLVNKNYYLINDSLKVMTKLINDLGHSGFLNDLKKDLLHTTKKIAGFECYCKRGVQADTIKIMDSNFILNTKMDAWFAKELYFPFYIDEQFGVSTMLSDMSICLMMEFHITSIDSSVNENVRITAITIDQNKLPDHIFQIPTTYMIKNEKASDIFVTQTKTEVKITDMKIEELDSIPPPPPQAPKPIKTPAKKTKQTKPVKG